VKPPYPWWCGYPGCAITRECDDGICQVEEAILSANSSAGGALDSNRAMPEVRPTDRVRVDRPENETSAPIGANGMHPMLRRMGGKD
jgi:hypothetical protein